VGDDWTDTSCQRGDEKTKWGKAKGGHAKKNFMGAGSGWDVGKGVGVKGKKQGGTPRGRRARGGGEHPNRVKRKGTRLNDGKKMGGKTHQSERGGGSQ